MSKPVRIATLGSMAMCPYCRRIHRVDRVPPCDVSVLRVDRAERTIRDLIAHPFEHLKSDYAKPVFKRTRNSKRA